MFVHLKRLQVLSLFTNECLVFSGSRKWMRGGGGAVLAARAGLTSAGRLQIGSESHCSSLTCPHLQPATLPSYIGKASRGQKTTCLQEYHGGRIRPLFWSNDKILCSSTKTLMPGKKLERLHLGLFSSRSLNKLCFDVSFSYEFK